MTLASVTIAGEFLDRNKGEIRGQKEYLSGHSHQKEGLEFSFFGQLSFSQSNREERSVSGMHRLPHLPCKRQTPRASVTVVVTGSVQDWNCASEDGGAEWGRKGSIFCRQVCRKKNMWEH